jgi:hypothetical protein
MNKMTPDCLQEMKMLLQRDRGAIKIVSNLLHFDPRTISTISREIDADNLPTILPECKKNRSMSYKEKCERDAEAVHPFIKDFVSRGNGWVIFR